MHVFEDRSVVSIFEIHPYSALGGAGLCEQFWGGSLDRAAGDVGEKASAEKDGEDAEILGGVGYGYACVACAEGVLEARAEVKREGHRSQLASLSGGWDTMGVVGG
jgi:hypothetical protein